MRIGLNLLHAMPEIGGGWNYIRDIIRSLLAVNSDNHYVIFITDKSAPIILDEPENVTIVRAKFDSSNRIKRLIYENVILPVKVLKYNLDCMHWFCNYHAPVNFLPAIVTVYDLQPFKQLNKDPFLKRVMLKFMVKNAVKKARYLLPMSEATQSDLSSILKADLGKMVVIPPILNPAFNISDINDKMISAFRVKYRLPDKYWIYVAHYYPHKNHILLLHAYHALISSANAQPWSLVLRGDRLSESEEILSTLQRLNLTEQVTLLPRLDEGELSLLYAAAGAMVFPSSYEGGGIPVLEAMACGCPVISSNLPSILEYAGDSVLYFNQENCDEITSSMQLLQNDTILRDSLRLKGLTQAVRYTSDYIVPKLLDVYSSIYNKI